jgi:hypothetical protein
VRSDLGRDGDGFYDAPLSADTIKAKGLSRGAGRHPREPRQASAGADQHEHRRRTHDARDRLRSERDRLLDPAIRAPGLRRESLESFERMFHEAKRVGVGRNLLFTAPPGVQA